MKQALTLLFLFLTFLARAQFCSGGLGDLITNITFGAGSARFGGALTAGISNMQYVANQCPMDGTYTITNRTDDCYPGDWLNVDADHTGNPNGYFMLINASVQPSDFYVQTVTGLCPSTPYQFAAWVLNMASHTGEGLPNITFSIEQTDGTVLQSFQTGDVPSANPAKWNPYAFNFTTPAGVSSVVLRMRNNAPGGYGNDLAIDDITFRTAGPSVGLSIAGHNGDTVTLCPDPANSLQFLSAVSGCYSSTDYQWQESSDNGRSWNNIAGATGTTWVASPTATGNYLYRLAVAQAGNIGLLTCRVVSAPDSVVILPNSDPAISIELKEGYVCVDSVASFSAVPVDGGSAPLYQWMVNNAPMGAGGTAYSSSTLNDGDRVDCLLTSDAVCAVHSSVLSNIITINLVPDVVAAIDISASANDICHDSLVVFTASPSNGGSHPSYQWMLNGRPAGEGASVYSSADLNNGDVVSAVMTVNERCSSPVGSNVVVMTVYAIPHITLTPDTIIAAGSSITLDPIITGSIVSHQWSPVIWLDDPSLLDPVASPAVNTTYRLDVQNGGGCAASAKEVVVVFYDLVLPNAFTPNGDGHNDLFRIPPSIPVTIQRLSVFDRWGAVVFATANGSEGWDGRMQGRPQPAGTYVWIVEYYNPILKKVMIKKGTVELVR